MTPNPQDSAVALEVERAAFEANYEKRHGFPLNTRRRDDGRYGDWHSQDLWEAWQARASQADGTSGGWQAIAGHDPLRELHDLLYVAQRIEGVQRDKAISRARVIVHQLSANVQSSLTPDAFKGAALTTPSQGEAS